jgi:hypothetical protein
MNEVCEMLATTVIELYMSLPTHIDHKPSIFGYAMPIIIGNQKGGEQHE